MTVKKGLDMTVEMAIYPPLVTLTQSTYKNTHVSSIPWSLLKVYIPPSTSN